MTFSAYFRIAAQLVVFFILARFLGAEQFGQFSYWFSAASLVSIPINYGFGTQLLREVAKTPENLQSMLTSMLFTKMLLTLTVFSLSVLFWVIAVDSALFIILLIVAIAESYVDFYNYVLRCRGLYEQEARLILVISLIQLPIVACTALLTMNAIFVAVAYLFSRAIALVLTRRVVCQYLPEKNTKIGLSLMTVREAMRSGFPYAADIGVTTFNSAIDVVLLKQMADLHSVGIYQAGMRLMLGATTPATVAVNVYLPRISSLNSTSVEYSQAIISLNMKMVVVGGAFSLIFALFGELITSVLFGSEYQALSKALPLFALLLVLRYVAAALGINLTASGYQSVRVVANLIYCVVFVVVSLFLVPVYKVLGLVVASICSVLALIIIYYIYVVVKKLPAGFNIFNSLIFASIIIFITYFIMTV